MKKLIIYLQCLVFGFIVIARHKNKVGHQSWSNVKITLADNTLSYAGFRDLEHVEDGVYVVSRIDRTYLDD